MPGAARQTRLPPLLGISLVVLAALVLRAPVLRYTFFADDHLFLDQVRGASIVSAWAVDDPLRNYWRPLSRQLYFWVVSRCGESPVVAHVLNLTLLLGIVVLVWAVGRRLAGERAGVIAAAIVAVHEAADVPVLWASGSQDLLAVLGRSGHCTWRCAAGSAGRRRRSWPACCPRRPSPPLPPSRSGCCGNAARRGPGA